MEKVEYSDDLARQLEMAAWKTFGTCRLVVQNSIGTPEQKAG